MCGITNLQIPAGAGCELYRFPQMREQGRRHAGIGYQNVGTRPRYFFAYNSKTTGATKLKILLEVPTTTGHL